jgi:hypothetical protein
MATKRSAPVELTAEDIRLMEGPQLRGGWSGQTMREFREVNRKHVPLPEGGFASVIDEEVEAFLAGARRFAFGALGWTPGAFDGATMDDYQQAVLGYMARTRGDYDGGGAPAQPGHEPAPRSERALPPPACEAERPPTKKDANIQNLIPTIPRWEWMQDKERLEALKDRGCRASQTTLEYATGRRKRQRRATGRRKRKGAHDEK